MITASLITQRTKSAGDLLVPFYWRRIKRLLPTLLVCVVVTSLAISLFNPLPRSHLYTGMASLVGLSNIVLYLRATDYWGETARLDPFTHTWSLGVEEQFYLVFPALLWWMLLRSGARTRMHEMALVCAAICVLSFAGFAILQARDSQAAHYLPMFRFWQLGLGCIVAIGVAARPHAILSSIPPLVPLGGIVLLLFAPARHVLWSTLFITLLTTWLIASNVHRRDPTLLLTNAPVRYIGRISYSLYLWHWPVIVLSLWTIGIQWWSWPIQLGLIACLAAASYHGIERPLRRASWSANSPGGARVRALAAVLLVLWPPVLAAGLPLRKWFGGPSLFLGVHAAPAAKQVAGIECGRGQVGRTIRTIGNSHSTHILPMLQPIARVCALELKYSRRDGDYIDYPRGIGVDAGLADRALQDLKAGDVLILSSRYHLLYQRPYLDSIGEKWQGPNNEAQLVKRRGALDVWLRELDDLLDRAGARGVQVVQFLPNIELDTPKSGLPAPLCTEQWFRILDFGCRPEVSRGFLGARFPDLWFDELAKRERGRVGFHVFDPIPVYCPGAAACPRSVRGINILRDTNHLSIEGAQLMVRPFVTFLEQRKLLEVRLASPGDH